MYLLLEQEVTLHLGRAMAQLGVINFFITL
jgi:hypothetical protein